MKTNASFSSWESGKPTETQSTIAGMKDYNIDLKTPCSKYQPISLIKLIKEDNFYIWDELILINNMSRQNNITFIINIPSLYFIHLKYLPSLVV